jgi:hypothetical protein
LSDLSGNSLTRRVALSKKLVLGAVGLLLVLLSMTFPASAAFKTETFALSGDGSFMDSPPVFSGNIIAGTLAPGTFWFRLDDTAWPSDDPLTTNNERWDFIFSNYFQYDPTEGAEGWDGRFPSSGLGDIAPEWRFETDAGDICGGLTTSFTVSIRDLNGNGIMEDNEYINKVLSIGLYCYINFGTGEFQSFCGQGNCSGTLDLVDEITWNEDLYVPSVEYPSGRLYLRDTNCTTGEDESSWGKIKKIYNN